ncbi:hypothetical protein [Curtobacterium sp. MCPF17_052]|uniref:hypothetical protein n=1 Tax=Curtobacterium sp. MCPF17_052 TaxID=2175655 RepID=UPI0024DF5995|nr:hypothetical protein [Curtobacterium sp. MCPF17_052]WIB13652.1 hypothetical protein DEJ36_08080 [Curtobacterium sp. MCPF17_052]
MQRFADRAMDALVWVVFVVLFIGAALLVKVAAALLVVLIVLALLLGLTLRVLRRGRAARPPPVRHGEPSVNRSRSAPGPSGRATRAARPVGLPGERSRDRCRQARTSGVRVRRHRGGPLQADA